MKAKIDVKKMICIVASVLITIFFIYLAISHFSNSYLRLGETFRDLWNSMKYYFLRFSRWNTIRKLPSRTIQRL